MRKINLVITEPRKDTDDIHVSKMDDIVDGSVDELVLDHVLEHAPSYEEALGKLVKKVRIGGQIHITGPDMIDISRAIFLSAITVEKANQILYGGGKQSCQTIWGVINQLSTHNFRPHIVELDDYTFYIMAKRMA